MKITSIIFNVFFIDLFGRHHNIKRSYLWSFLRHPTGERSRGFRFTFEETCCSIVVAIWKGTCLNQTQYIERYQDENKVLKMLCFI